jgi:hypothetical protein
MARMLVVVGLVIVLLGLFWPYVSRFPLGRLPGDLSFHHNGTRFYFPLVSSILVSVIVSLVLRVFRR